MTTEANVAQDPDKATDEGADATVPEGGSAPESVDEVDETAEALLAEAGLTPAEELAQQEAQARPTRKASATATLEDEGKGRPTPKQQRQARTREHQRTGPIQFVKESIEELRKVNWPTLDTWQQYFIVVLVFVLIIIAIVSSLDLFFGWALLAIFG